MSKLNEVKTLAEMIAERKEYHAKVTQESIKKIEANYEAAARLEGAGFDLNLNKWNDLSSIYLRAKDSDDLRKIRLALDCPLVHSYTEVEDARKRLVRISFRPKLYECVHITLVKKMPPRKLSKCKIVYTTRRERRLSL